MRGKMNLKKKDGCILNPYCVAGTLHRLPSHLIDIQSCSLSSYCLLSIYNVPGIVLSVLEALGHFLTSITL